MTVRAFEERRIAVTDKVSNGLLVNSAVQKSRHVIMPQCVKMKLGRQTDAVIYFAESLRERIGMNELAVLIREYVFAEFLSASVCLAFLLCIETGNEPGDITSGRSTSGRIKNTLLA